MKWESPHLSGLARHSRLARSVSNAGLGECLRMLAYKCVWPGTAFVRIDRWYRHRAAPAGP